MKKMMCFGLVIAFSLSLCSCVVKNDQETTAMDESLLTASDTSDIAETTEPEQTEVSLADLLGTITLENYPVVDGSTATIPLAIGLIQKMTGCTEAQAEE